MSLDLIDGMLVSRALSRIASVGTDVLFFKFACAGIDVIVSMMATRAVISFFIKTILLNSSESVNT